MFYLILVAVGSLGVMSNPLDNINPLINPTNDLWQRNDKLLITMDFIYDNLAGPVQNEVCITLKRSFSIIAQSIMAHVRKPDKTPGKVLKKIKKLLKHPADVIAVDVRRDLDLLRAIIDQPLNDIKVFCQPNTTSLECEQKLIYHTALRTLECPFYLNHLKLREDLETLILGEDFQNLLEDAVKSSVHATDKKAIDFFVENVNREVLGKMAELYRKYKYDIFPCMYTGLFKNWQELLCSNVNNMLQ